MRHLFKALKKVAAGSDMEKQLQKLLDDHRHGSMEKLQYKIKKLEKDKEAIDKEIEQINKILEQSQLVASKKASARYGKGIVQLFPDVASKIHEIVEDAADTIEHKYEALGKSVEEIEHETREGFISSNDGGYSAKLFCDLVHLWGSGNYTNFPKEAVEKIDKLIIFSLDMAKESFIKDHKKELEGISEDKINYHDLYEMGKKDLAEELSSYEMESMSEDTIMVDIVVMAVNEIEKGAGITFYVQGAVNWETPYHRPGKSNEAAKEIVLEYGSVEEMEKNAEKDIKKAVDDIVGWLA